MSATVTARDDKRNFAYYLVGTLFFAGPVAHLFFSMWTSGAHAFLLNTVNIPFAQPGGQSLQAILMLAGGVFFSLLILFANDWRKRYQGFILISTTVLVLVLLDLLGIGLATERINLTSGLNIGVFFVGVAIGLMTELRRSDDGGGDLLSIDFRHDDSGWAHWIVPERNRNRPAEFAAAYRYLVVAIVLVVLAANALNIVYNGSTVQILLHSGASVGLLYFIYSLLDINTMTLGGSAESESDPDETQFEVLGPQQSGKTYLALGINLTVRNNNQYQLEGLRGRMPDIVEEHADRVTGQREGLTDWGIGNTMIDAAEKVVLEFVRKNTKQGELLSATVNMYDYPGEVLEGLAKEYNQKRGKQMTDGGEPAEDDPEAADTETQSSADGDTEGSLGSIEDIIGDVEFDEPLEDESPDDSADSVDPQTTEDSNDSDNSVDPQVTEDDDGDVANDTASPETIDLDEIDGAVPDDESPRTDTSPAANPLDGQDYDSASDQPTVGTDTDTVPGNTDTDDDSTSSDTDTTTSPTIGDSASPTREITTGAVKDTDSPTAQDDDTDESVGDSSQTPQDSSNGVQTVSNISPDEIDKVKKALIKNVGTADKLLVLIDSQRFVTDGDIMADDPGMMLKEMTQIVQGAGPDEIIPVATKADHFIPEYDNLTSGTTPTSGEFEEFSEHVHQRLSSHPMAGNLIELADYQVFPLFFLTGTDKNGEQKLRVKDGQIRPIGYDQLIDAVVRQ